ncbi:MAG: aldehyde dehydrogenase family protein [Polyangiales bacterium]
MSSDYVAGRFEAPASPDGQIEVKSPADQSDVVGVHPYAVAQVDRAIAAAREAFPAWRRLPEAKRAELLKAYQARLKAHETDLAKTIAREIGKPLWEAKTEVGAMISKVDLSIGEGASYTRDVKLDDLPGEVRHRPHGVLAVVGPFNFPGHLPNGQIVPALLAGNTVVFKPSEKGAGTAVLMARCYDEAGFPAGTFNVVQGEAHVARAIVGHPGIDGILFTGSVAVGKAIAAANADRPGRLIALELGGKNASIVLDDCDLERTAREVAFSGFATAGQRCTCTSRVIVTLGVADALIAKLAAAAKSARVGHPFEEGVFMGPVISRGSRDAILVAQEKARAAGFTAAAPGGIAQVEGREGWYLRPAVHVAPSSKTKVAGYTDHELFGPDLSVFVVDTLDEAIALADDTPYGLAAAVFTKDREAFEACADRLRVGVLHWNRSSAGASSRLPFGGVKDSGNHRPAGILAGAACSYPMGVLLPPKTEPALPTWPGLTFS